MPRRLLVLLVVSLVVLTAVAARLFFFPPTNPRITRENWERIKEGMRREEVESLLGLPGDYRKGPTGRLTTIFFISGEDMETSAILSGTPKPFLWQGDRYEIGVVFDPDERVRESKVSDMEPDEVPLLKLLRWRWNRWWESRR
jgi:hypothetical protein